MKNFLRKITLIIVIALCSLFLFLWLLDGMIMPYIIRVKNGRVPALKNQPMNKASKELRLVGLRIAIRDTVYSELVTPGNVVEQTPNPGQPIKKGRRVFVDLSQGPRLHEVPNIKGGSIRDARLQIWGNQLQLGDLVYVSSATVPQGVVLRQHPRAGTAIAREGNVHIEVSSGSPNDPKRVPNVKGTSIDTAEDSLRKYEMLLGTIVERVDNSAPLGIILAQQPDAEERVARNTAVNVTISVEETVVEIDTTDIGSP